MHHGSEKMGQNRDTSVGATSSTGRRRRGGRVCVMDSVWRGHQGCGGRSCGDMRRSICENWVLGTGTGNDEVCG